MALRDFIPGLRTKAAVPAPVASGSTPYHFLAQTGREILPHEAWRLYKSVSTFAITVDLIADQIATMQTITEVNGRTVEGHPLDLLLGRPGFNRSRRQLVKEIAVQHLVTGTAYINLIGSLKQLPFSVDTYLSHHVNHVEGADGWPQTIQLAEARQTRNYNRVDVRGDMRFIADDYNELLVVYDMCGDTKGRGLSRLQAVRGDVDLKLSSIQHNVNMMNRGATLSGVLAYKEKLTPETAEAIRNDIRSNMAGAANAGGILVTGGGDVDFKGLTQSNKDMDWTNLVKVVNESIISRYNVPITIYSVDAQTDNNYHTAWEQFYQQAVLPQFGIIYGALAQAASARTGENIEIRHDALSVDVLAAKAVDRATKLVSAQLISPNEGRQTIGYEPFLGGDQVLGPPGLTPIYEDYMTDLIDAEFTETPGSAGAIGQDTESKTAFRALSYEKTR
jgi:HK97 family phage portal protein